MNSTTTVANLPVLKIGIASIFKRYSLNLLYAFTILGKQNEMLQILD
jgi:hypothetical protein